MIEDLIVLTWKLYQSKRQRHETRDRGDCVALWGRMAGNNSSSHQHVSQLDNGHDIKIAAHSYKFDERGV